MIVIVKRTNVEAELAITPHFHASNPCPLLDVSIAMAFPVRG
jgi:hypothetical protein